MAELHFWNAKRVLPHEPEVGFEELWAEPVHDSGALKLFFRCEGDGQKFHSVALGESHGGDVLLLTVLIDQASCGKGLVGVEELHQFLVN